MTYTNDAIACGSGVAMYDAMDREGHDARYLSFAPATGANGGHRDPENAWAWVVGCLGVTSACSSACAASFAACVDADGGADGPAKFASCETQLKAGSLGGCVVGCAPTLEMLRTSEQPVVSLSAGKFGTSTGLAVAASAPRPLCTTAIGEFGTNGITGGQCTPPSATVYPDFTIVASPKMLLLLSLVGSSRHSTSKRRVDERGDLRRECKSLWTQWSHSELCPAFATPTRAFSQL